MAASPPPNSPPAAVSPASNTTASPSPSSTGPPPQSSSPPPATSPPSQPNAITPDSSPPTPSVPAAPPPATTSAPLPPPTVASPVPAFNSDITSPPSDLPPPPQSASPPVIPPPLAPPTSPPPSPPSSNAPLTSPPPSSSNPPPTSSAAPPSVPPTSSSPPPPQSPAPQTSPPPPPTPARPPQSPPPPPPPSSSPPTQTSPPPPVTPSQPPGSVPPPVTSPPPPASVPPPATSPPPPESAPPKNSPPTVPVAPGPAKAPPTPRLIPPTPPASQPISSPSNSRPPVITLSPPPPSRISPTSSSDNTIPNTPESSNSTGNEGIGVGGIAAIGAVAGIILLSLIGFALWCFRRQRKEVSGLNGVYAVPSSMESSPTSDSAVAKTQSSAPLIQSGSSSDAGPLPTEPGGLGNSKSWCSFEELVKATNGFSSQNLLGEGGFGAVYKGLLADGRVVAVKQLKIGGGQGEREFKAEVEIISRIHHRHLVSLVGYCICENRRLLVYDYVPNKTLHFHLHEQGRPVLDWGTRVKIAAGAARGIAYLHEDCHPRIIHRDIKSSNILLDDNYEAKVSDFGLAKLALDANTHVTTRVMGTFGYMAPEYASSGKLTEKSDVFSYGVVVLELITGREPVDASQPLGEESLVEWARPLLSYALENGEFEGLADPSLEKSYIESEMFRMIEVAAACVRHSSAKRPRMGQVVRAFDSLATCDLSNGLRVGESELFRSAPQSEEIRLFRRMAFGSQNYSTEFFSSPNSLNI